MRLFEILPLFEAPLDIEPLNDHLLNSPDGNREYFQKFIKIVEPIEQLSNNIILYHGEGSKNGTYMAADPQKQQIYYFMQYRRSANPILKSFVYQSFLWMDKSKRSIVGYLPNYYFFDLIDDYSTIATDSEQTPDGKKFWIKRIKDAFNKGLNVYYFNETADTLIQLQSQNDVEIFNKKYQIYSTHESSLFKLFVISKNNLKI